MDDVFWTQVSYTCIKFIFPWMKIFTQLSVVLIALNPNVFYIYCKLDKTQTVSTALTLKRIEMTVSCTTVVQFWCSFLFLFLFFTLEKFNIRNRREIYISLYRSTFNTYLYQMFKPSAVICTIFAIGSDINSRISFLTLCWFNSFFFSFFCKYLVPLQYRLVVEFPVKWNHHFVMLSYILCQRFSTKWWLKSSFDRFTKYNKTSNSLCWAIAIQSITIPRRRCVHIPEKWN